MDGSTNALNWFEIPAEHIGRAKNFYESIFNIVMETSEMMGMQMAFFPFETGSGKTSGALVQSQMHKPCTLGSIIYLNGNPDLQIVLDKVEGAGGSVAMIKTKINDDVGHMAFIIDSEGNKVALHSQN